MIYEGRPGEPRTTVEEKTYDFLDKLEVEYFRADHEEAATIELCKEIEKEIDAHICKNLFLCNRNKTSFYLLIMPGDKPFKTKELSSQIYTSRLSFASGEDMVEMLGIKPGSVTVLALMNDFEGKVQLIIDRDLLELEYLGCHPCMNTSSLKIKTSDIIKKFLKHTGHRHTVVRL